MRQNIFIAMLLLIVNVVGAQKQLAHYIFFGMDRDRIKEDSFLKNDEIEGAQLKYSWKELEPARDGYEFESIREDIKFLAGNGKKLFIQLQDVTFDTVRVFVPDYIITDTAYHGGVDIQYEFQGEDDVIVRQDGWVARRWDPKVAQRFHQLIGKLGEEFDGEIEGINLPETAVGFGTTGKYHPVGFTYEVYAEAIKQNMLILRNAFPSSSVIQYANFMPGEWLPWEDKGYLKSLFIFAMDEDVGMGGPDIKIWKKAQMNHSYGFLKTYTRFLTTGMAVQDGNYEEINPKTGVRVSVPELFDFGNSYLELDYIFWCTQEPYYKTEVLPFLHNLRHLSKNTCPASVNFLNSD